MPKSWKTEGEVKPWERFDDAGNPVDQAPAPKPWENYTEDGLQKADPVSSAINRGMSAVVEPALTVGSAIVAEPLAGIAGMAQGINPFADPGASGQAVRATQEALTYTPKTEAGMEGLQTLGRGVENVIDVARYPLSGLWGLVELAETGDLDSAAEGVRRVQDEGLSKTWGDRTLEKSGSPLLATIAYSTPTASLELLGLKPSLAAGVKLNQRIARTLGKKGEQWATRSDDILKQVEEIKKAIPEDQWADAAEAIKKGDPNELAAIVQPDSAFYQAADELGVNVEPIASFASQNPRYIDVEQALRSVPGSQLDEQARIFMGAVSQKADDLIGEYGGTLDKAGLSDSFRTRSLNTIDEMNTSIDDLYETLDAAIPQKTRVPADDTVAFITSKAEELGGTKELPKRMRSILKALSPKKKTIKSAQRDMLTGQVTPARVETVYPTHGKLNQIRREVGQALNRKSGPFKDVEEGLLKALYGRLRNDQDNVVRALKQQGVDVEDVSDAARNLVIQRKQLESNLQALLGKDLQGSLMPRVGASIRGLGKGKVTEWDNVMQAIPRNMRQEVVVSSLNDIFRGTGVGGNAFNATQFTKFMDELARQPAMKARLYNQLPKPMQRSMDNLYTLSKGISKAQGAKVPTGRILTLFDSQNSKLVNRLMGNLSQVALAKATGPVGGMMGGAVVREFLENSSDGARAANQALANREFQNMMRVAVREGYVEGREISRKLQAAEKAFMRSQAYKRWAENLDATAATQLATEGVIGYLMSDSEEKPQ